MILDNVIQTKTAFGFLIIENRMQNQLNTLDFSNNSVRVSDSSQNSTDYIKVIG